MKATLILRWSLTLSLFTACVVTAVPPFADDFNDGNDNGWLHYDPLGGLGAGGVGTWSFPTGAYRLQATAASLPQTTGPARVGSYRTNVFAEFEARMDVMHWPANLDQLFGVTSRVREPGAGTTDGYTFAYETRIGRAATGRLQILRLLNEQSTVLASTDMNLTQGRQYRFIFTGLLTELKGQVFDLTNTTTAVATLTATDATYTTGTSGFFVYDTGTGGNHPVDITVDNISAGPPSPKLTITVHEPTQNIYVSWPAWAASFTLESSFDLIGWDPVGFNISQGEEIFEHSDNFDGLRFYRLVTH